MSVQRWRRQLSRTQFLYDIFQLNIRLGQIVANAPVQKYAHSYGNALITTAQQAMMHAQTGNSIYVVDDASYEARRTQFQLCIGCVGNIATTAYIYIETMRRHDGVKPEKAEKMYGWEDEIGSSCDTIIGYVQAVMKHDRDAWAAKKRGKSGD